MKTIPVRIDQAVWERMHVSVEVPEDLEGEALREFIREAVANCDYRHIETEIVAEVEHHETIREASFDDGRNYEEI